MNILDTVESTKAIKKLLKSADMNEIAVVFAKSEEFMRALSEAMALKYRDQSSAEILPNELCAKQVRMLLGGISDRTLNRYRHKYPEMISGGPLSKSYKKAVVLQIAKNKHISPVML